MSGITPDIFVLIMEISLFYLSNVFGNGVVTYTCHLREAFRRNGYNCNIYKLTKRTESSERVLAGNVYGVTYRNLCLDDFIEKMESSDISIVVATVHKGYLNKLEYDVYDRLMDAVSNNCIVLIHAVWEVNEQYTEDLQAYDILVCPIRTGIETYLKSLGLNVLETVRHPYVVGMKTNCEEEVVPTSDAVSVARISKVKGILDVILASKEISIDFYGQQTPQYVNYQLSKILGFEQYTKLQVMLPSYKGTYKTGCGVSVMKNYKFVIDLSIPQHNDGGGSQYTFLEAFEAGAVLVTSKGWTSLSDNSEGSLIENFNTISISSKDGLIKNLLSDNEYDEIIENSKNTLEYYSPKIVCKKFIKIYEENFR